MQLPSDPAQMSGAPNLGGQAMSPQGMPQMAPQGVPQGQAMFRGGPVLQQYSFGRDSPSMMAPHNAGGFPRYGAPYAGPPGGFPQGGYGGGYPQQSTNPGMYQGAPPMGGGGMSYQQRPQYSGGPPQIQGWRPGQPPTFSNPPNFRGGGPRGRYGGPRDNAAHESYQRQRQWQKQVLCCYFMQGQCKYAEKCRYSHIDGGQTCHFGLSCRVPGHATRKTLLIDSATPGGLSSVSSGLCTPVTEPPAVQQ